jgi:hypothetical protein
MKMQDTVKEREKGEQALPFLSFLSEHLSFKSHDFNGFPHLFFVYSRNYVRSVHITVKDLRSSAEKIIKSHSLQSAEAWMI